MRKVIVVPILLSVVAGCSAEPTATELAGIVDIQAAHGGVTASATGSGIIAPGIRKFAFQANTQSSSVTKGNAQLTFPGQNTKLHMTLDCLEINGSQATMSGYVKSVKNNAAIQAGDPVWFRVVDNGEPSVNDQITLVTIFIGVPGVPCDQEGPFPGLAVIQAGNVQVR